ncbi:MAG TPA: hypothetical protein VE642_01145 [Pyrinomonadaceae bacterium]|nr:hypothetical protein [Pyrinomonadaceae bacterium]
MVKWLASSFLLAALGISAVAGMPLHSGEHECNMPGMKDGMDCCAKARARQDTPEVAAARLCCAINCSSPGTAQTGIRLRLSPLAAAAPRANTFKTAPVTLSPVLLYGLVSGHPQHSPPAYIQHLALLI